MKYLMEIVNRRAIPGMLIMDSENRVLYANVEAVGMMESVQRLRSALDAGYRPVPCEIVELCQQLKSCKTASSAVAGELTGFEVGDACSLRAFFIGEQAQAAERHIMVLVERVVKRRLPDFAGAKERYRLSNRELEVLQWVCQGFTNKEIADTMYISEYTVKDHIKKIMRNMGVNTRSGMIAVLR